MGVSGNNLFVGCNSSIENSIKPPSDTIGQRDEDAAQHLTTKVEPCHNFPWECSNFEDSRL